MDPTAAIKALLDAIARNDREDIENYLNSLRSWNYVEGFWPEISCNVDGKVWTIGG